MARNLDDSMASETERIASISQATVMCTVHLVDIDEVLLVLQMIHHVVMGFRVVQVKTLATMTATMVE